MINRGVLFGFAIAASAFVYMIEDDRSEKSAVARSVLAPDGTVSPVFAPAATDAQALRAPAQTQAVVQLPADVTSVLKELKRLETCYETDCDYEHSYPQASSYAIGRDLKAALIHLAHLAQTQHLQLRELGVAARHFLQNDDGHVKEGALRLLATQEPSAESLHAILDDVIADTDAQLIEPAMHELSRYSGASDRELIHENLSVSLLTGAPFVAEKISQNLNLFIDQKSLATYTHVTAQTSDGSRLRANLRAQISDYQKRQSGG